MNELIVAVFLLFWSFSWITEGQKNITPSSFDRIYTDDGSILVSVYWNNNKDIEIIKWFSGNQLLIWIKPLLSHQSYSWSWWEDTWYVSSYVKINWRWNASQWIEKATNKWHKTWDIPLEWSIIILWGKEYNPKYQHVAIVRKVEKDYLIISEMNYRKLWEITFRKIKSKWDHIKWYIYMENNKKDVKLKKYWTKNK
jgi:hypothetical protein